MSIKSLLLAGAVLLIPSQSVFAQAVCDEAVFVQCQAACVTAQPACGEKEPLSLADIRAVIAENCGCTITEADDTPEEDSDTCSCSDTVKNYGKYRSCVAKLSDTLKQFKLSDSAARDQLKADNSLCKSAINDNKGGKNDDKKDDNNDDKNNGKGKDD